MPDGSQLFKKLAHLLNDTLNTREGTLYSPRELFIPPLVLGGVRGHSRKGKNLMERAKTKRQKSYGEGGGLRHARGNDNEYVTQSNHNSFIII